MRPGRRLRRAILAVLLIADFAFLLMTGSRFFARLDMSRNGIYTLSRTSKDIMAALPEPLSMEYWVSGLLASRYPFPSQIEDLLGEYATWSRGKVSFRVVDPASRRITPESLGLQARQVQTIDRDQVNLATVYSGIVLRYLDRAVTLPFVADLTTLEYDVSSRIRSLEQNRTITVGLLVGDSRRSLARDFRSLTQELGFQFRMTEVARGADIPPDVSVLFVLGNRDIDDAAMVPIDQYIMRGGRVLFAVDSVDVELSKGISAQLTARRVVQDALAQYGVRVLDALVLDSLNQRISFTVPPGRVMQEPYPPWISVSGRQVDPSSPITARFSGLDLYWPCPLEPIERDGVHADILASSSPDSWTMQDSFPINPALAQSMAPAEGQARSPHAVAIALSGSFHSAYEGRPVPSGAAQKPGLLSSSQKDTRIIVIGNEEFATDLISFTQATQNMTFLSNCAVWLALDDDLLAVKTRAQASTRLDAIPDPADRLRVMRSSVVVNVIVVPLAVIAIGLIRLVVARKRRSHASETKSPEADP